MSIINKIYTNQKLYILSLVVLFLISFAIPLFFAFTLGGLLNNFGPGSDSNSAQQSTQENEPQEKDSVFPDAIGISSPNTFITVKSSPSLEPQEGKDFLIAVWVKLKKLPLVGESFVVFSKYDEKSSARKGYSFSLTKEQESLRPSLYWKDNSNGTWFTFSEVNLEPKHWTLFVITFRDDKYLGLHVATLPDAQAENSQAAIKLLGGHELSNKILPQNKADLLIGSFNGGKFRGKIGPLGIFSSKSLTENLNNILTSLIESPREVPEQFEESDVGLWIPDDRSDQSANQNVITLPKAKRNAERE